MGGMLHESISGNMLLEGNFLGVERVNYDPWSEWSESSFNPGGVINQNGNLYGNPCSDLQQETIEEVDEKNGVVGINAIAEYVGVSSDEYVDACTFEDTFTPDKTFTPNKIPNLDNSTKIYTCKPPNIPLNRKSRSIIAKSQLERIKVLRASGLRYSESGIKIEVAKRTPKTKHLHDATELYYDPGIAGLRNLTQEEVDTFEHVANRKRKNAITQKKRDSGQDLYAELQERNRVLEEENARIVQANVELVATDHRLSGHGTVWETERVRMRVGTCWCVCVLCVCVCVNTITNLVSYEYTDI